MRAGSTVPGRDVRLQFHLVPRRLLRRQSAVSAGQHQRGVRHRWRELRVVRRAELRGAGVPGVQLDELPHRLLQRRDVRDDALGALVREQRRSLHGVQLATRRPVRGRRLSVRHQPAVRGRPALLERNVRVRQPLVPDRLLHGWLVRHAAHDDELRSGWRRLCQLRLDDQRRVPSQRKLRLRHGSRVRCRTALRFERLRVRRDLVPHRLLRGQRLPARQHAGCVRRRRAGVLHL